MVKKRNGSESSFFSSVRGKFLITGVLGVLAALIVGLVGITSVSKNSNNSEIVSLVNEISLLQSQNIANDAMY